MKAITFFLPSQFSGSLQRSPSQLSLELPSQPHRLLLTCYGGKPLEFQRSHQSQQNPNRETLRVGLLPTLLLSTAHSQSLLNHTFLALHLPDSLQL